MTALLLILIIAVSANSNFEDLHGTIKNLNAELDKVELTRAAELRFSSADMDDKTVRSGSSFELKCEVYAVPPPVFRWTLNGKEIAGVLDANLFEKLSNIGKSTLQNGVVASRIRIPCADKKHRGKYRCIATNGHRTIETSAKISIVGSEVCSSNEFAPPQIIQFTDSRFEIQDNAVQLMCRVAKPGATIAWYFIKDGEVRVPLIDNADFEILANGDLLVKRCDFETRVGTYICVASNEFGEDRAESCVLDDDDDVLEFHFNADRSRLLVRSQ
ncbi:immunoglobulin I-set domain protein [Dictyocaulus viviparus]|uniref:Immunoglobulin I-set domain protein n=1 Tax=Dictyocaulus viviparus TaxID=29172 RepID=A0A0D8X999_DICVI|nr:immunoglobulin I-set domain protein [Dictyocaulus viviparus]